MFFPSYDSTGLGSGDIRKSDASGTYFVTSIGDVNEDTAVTADFERLAGLPGIALVNIVSNPQDAHLVDKKLQTVITYNDGDLSHPMLYLDIDA